MNKRLMARLGVSLGLANVALGLAAVAFLFLNSSGRLFVNALNGSIRFSPFNPLNPLKKRPARDCAAARRFGVMMGP
jgi:hypothetical protein